MDSKKIKQHNSEQFILDLKSVRDVLVYAQSTSSFLRVRKKDVIRSAETGEIKYYMTDDIFVVKRNVMVIL